MPEIFAGQVRFGIHAGPQHTTYADYAALWKAAEDMGYDWCSVFDHFIPIFADPEGPCFEGLALLSAMAAQTTRVRCGVLVIGNTYRHPALLANMAATIDHISGGRLELGVGAGWWEMEHEEYGIELPPIGRRIRMLGETLPILKSLWTRAAHHLRGPLLPAHQRPLRAQARAETLDPALGRRRRRKAHPPRRRRVRRRLEHLLHAHPRLPAQARRPRRPLPRRVGRDPADIRKSLVVQAVVAKDESRLAERLERLGGSRGVSAEQMRQRAIVGMLEQCVEQLMPFLELGVHDFIIGARPPADLETLELVAAEIAPVIKKAAGSA